MDASITRTLLRIVPGIGHFTELCACMHCSAEVMVDVEFPLCARYGNTFKRLRLTLKGFVLSLGIKLVSKSKRLRAKLREKLDKRELIVAPGAHGPLYARFVEKAGFDCVYVTGFGTAANLLGMPDVGLITMSEMVTNVKNICRVVDIPVIADMNTGYGNAINAMRTVSEYEQAGVAGFHLEDQNFPKKCGCMKGKIVIPTDEMVGKIKSCIEARDDEDLVIVARTDSRAVEGNEAMWERANAYAEAGADVIFPEASTSIEETKEDLKHIKAPLLLNGLRFGQEVKDVKDWGIAILILPEATLLAAAQAAYDSLVEIKKTGSYTHLLEGPGRFLSLNKIAEVVGLRQVRMYEGKFLPKEEITKRYKSEKVPRGF